MTEKQGNTKQSSQMTEKHGNTKQSSLNYIHTVITIKKKKTWKSKVKKKEEIKNRNNFYRKEIANQKLGNERK